MTFLKVKQLCKTLYGELALYNHNGSLYAVKISNYENMITGSTENGYRAYDNTLNEFDIVQTVKSYNVPNVVNMYQSYFILINDVKHHVLVMEYVTHELYSLVESGNIPVEHNVKIQYQLAKTIQSLHANNIAHCDISLENVMLDNKFNARLIDFGIAKQIESNKLIRFASPKSLYTPPEYKRKCKMESFGLFKHDVFAFGVIFFALISGSLPFGKANPKTDSRWKCWITGKSNKLISDWNISHLVDDVALDLLEHIFCCPKKRFTMDQILQHAYWERHICENEHKMFVCK
jgi:serine/threonine protein kinase